MLKAVEIVPNHQRSDSLSLFVPEREESNVLGEVQYPLSFLEFLSRNKNECSTQNG